MKTFYCLTGLLILVLAVSYFLGFTPLLLTFIFLLMSLLTYVIYAKDKAAAKVGSQRTPENTLHLLALMGGWPGALLAQTRLRHKTIKMPFRGFFWSTVALNCMLLTSLHWTPIYLMQRNAFFVLESKAFEYSEDNWLAKGIIFLSHYLPRKHIIVWH